MFGGKGSFYRTEVKGKVYFEYFGAIFLACLFLGMILAGIVGIFRNADYLFIIAPSFILLAIISIFLVALPKPWIYRKIELLLDEKNAI